MKKLRKVNISLNQIFTEVLKFILLTALIIFVIELTQPYIGRYLGLFDTIKILSTKVKFLYVLIVIINIIIIWKKAKFYVKLDSSSMFFITLLFVIYTIYKYIFNHYAWEFSTLFKFQLNSHIDIDFKFLDIIYVFTTLYIFLAIRIYLRNLKSDKNKTETQDYSDLAIKTISQDRLDFYSGANELLNRIIKNPGYYNERAFCIGISSPWGSGKTSFLNLMQYAVEQDINSENFKKAIIIKFSPWLCNSSEQIIDDFMKVFSQNLIHYNPNIESELKKYSQILANAELGWFSKIFRIGITEKNETIEKQYLKLSESTLHLKNPILVFIDDVDRLNSKEILRVFQLIRNTANFKNTIFIVTYDKDYIVKALKTEVFKAEEYLEKIFTTQYYLPIVNKEKKTHFISELIGTALIASTEEKNYIQQFLIDINEDLSIRNVKRFLNQVIITKSKLISDGLQDLFLYDLLLIEYLHFKHRELYVVLHETGFEHPLFDSYNRIQLTKAELGKNLSDSEYLDKFIKPFVSYDYLATSAHNILKLIFEGSTNTKLIKFNDPYRLRYTGIFNLFFNINENKNIISKEVFTEIINLDNEIFTNKMYDWLNSANRELVIRLIENLKFESESNGLEIIKRFLIFIPDSYLSLKEQFSQGQSALFMAGSYHLNFLKDDEPGYRNQYMKTLRIFFNDYNNDSKSTIIRKFLLLISIEKFSHEIFRINSDEHDNRKARLGEMYILYLDKYLSFKPTFSSFELLFIENLNMIFSDKRESAKNLLKDYISNNLQDFIEQSSDFWAFKERFKLEYIFATQKDDLNDDLDKWLTPFMTFLDNQDYKVTTQKWFNNYRNLVERISRGIPY